MGWGEEGGGRWGWGLGGKQQRLQAHLLLGATLALPDVGGHNALHLFPQPGVLLELGRDGRGESHVHRGHRRGAPHPTRIQGSRGVGWEDTQKARDEGKRGLGSQEAEGTKPWPPFPPSVGSKWQFKGLSGSRPSLLAYLGNFGGRAVPTGRNASGLSLLRHLGSSHLGNGLLDGGLCLGAR